MKIEQAADVAEPLEQETQESASALREKLDQTKERLKDFSSEAFQRVEDSWDGLSDVVRENPMTSIGVALVAGLGLGSLLTALAKRD